MDEVPALEDRLRASDETALAALWAVHRPRLERLVLARQDARLPRRADAEDVLQEAYLAARSRIDRFASDGFQASIVWFRLLVIQTLTDLHRHHLGAQKRDVGREVAAAPASDASAATALVQRLAASGSSPSRVMVARERIDLVQKAITTLSEADRQILDLRHVELLTNGEAAEALGIEVKAASIRYIRAVRRLRDALADAGGLTTELAHAP